MQNKNGKMTMIKTDNDQAINEFFGKPTKQAEGDIWRVSLMLSKEDQEIIEKGFDALPRKFRAMRDYFREGMLEIAKRDIERGEVVKRAMADLEK